MFRKSGEVALSFGILIALGLVVRCSSTQSETDIGHIRKRQVFHPTECCICDDQSSDSSQWCSSPRVCEHNFKRCDYCETVKKYTGTSWKVTRGCNTESVCIANWYNTVTNFACTNSTGIEIRAGTTCYSCCRTPTPLKPHYCSESPDRFIAFNLTTLPTTTTAPTTTPTTTVPPVDGGWSAWSSWYGCTVACDGIQVRVRTCDSPFPSPNGAPCNGSAVQDEACDSTNCQPSSGVPIVG